MGWRCRDRLFCRFWFDGTRGGRETPHYLGRRLRLRDRLFFLNRRRRGGDFRCYWNRFQFRFSGRGLFDDWPRSFLNDLYRTPGDGGLLGKIFLPNLLREFFRN